MDKHKIMIAAGVGGVGLVGALYLRKRAAAAAAAASSGATTTSGNIDLGALSSLAPASTGVSTGGTYAVDTSAGSASDAALPSLDSSPSVASFAQLLQGILSSGAQATASAQAAAAANNTQATQAIQAVTPAPPSVAPAPATPPATPAYTGDRSLSQNVGGYLVANTGLYATDSNYRSAWDSVAGANQSRFGTGWNRIASGANQSDLNAELSGSYHG